MIMNSKGYDDLLLKINHLSFTEIL